MQLGMIGLGRVSTNTVRRLMHNDHQCVVCDRVPAAVFARVPSRGAANVQDRVPVATRAAFDGRSEQHAPA